MGLGGRGRKHHLWGLRSALTLALEHQACLSLRRLLVMACLLMLLMLMLMLCIQSRAVATSCVTQGGEA